MAVELPLERLGPADLILTPNRRLSAWLVRDYDRVKSNQGLNAWPGLQAHPLQDWLLKLGMQRAQLVLSDAQSLGLWYQALIEETDSLLENDRLKIATLSQQARNLLIRWQVKPAEWEDNSTIETELFSRLHQRYLGSLTQAGWLDQSGLWQALLKQSAPVIADRIWLHGFNDRREPLLGQLKTWLESTGAQVQFSVNQQTQANIGVRTLNQCQQQLPEALAWALDTIAGDNHKRVAVVVPELEQQRARVQTISRQLVAARLGPTEQWQSWINITAGASLKAYPAIAHLLLALKLMVNEGSFSEWQALLSSPYFSRGIADFSRRDQLLRTLKNNNRQYLSCHSMHQQWQSFCQQSGEFSSVFFQGLIKDTLTSGKAPASSWVRKVIHFSQHIEWCQDRPLDSVEYQVQQRFYEQLNALSELDATLGVMRFSEFLRWLNQLVANAIFQPQTQTAPIQVMGLLEAAGMSFDGIWICDTDSDHWPGTTKPNPLLSLSLQKKYQLPGSGAQRELAYAKELLASFTASAAKVVFSWGRMNREQECALTPLVSHFPEIVSHHPELESLCQQQPLNYQSPELEQFHAIGQWVQLSAPDTQGLALPDDKLSGGTALIKSQSLCPFQAYARYRMALSADEDFYEGVDPRDRGNLVHQALELFWQDTKNSHQLANLIAHPGLLQQKVEQAVSNALLLWKQTSWLQPEKLYQLEQQRAERILLHWLTEQESKRSDFQISALEQKQTLNLGGLTIRLKADRIDQLATGDHLIIDYKTRLMTIAATEGARPEEPQLPLYALSNPDQTKAVAFAVLRHDRISFSGLAQEGLSLFNESGVGSVDSPPDWPQQLATWHGHLLQLAQAIMAGEAKVDPINEQVCDHCDLQSLCRKQEKL